LVPVAVTERVKLLPLATTVDDTGWLVIAGVVPPELLLDEEEELELLLELLEEELMD
jgi:hypothetical protein